jgi:VWFA-related protein
VMLTRGLVTTAWILCAIGSSRVTIYAQAPETLVPYTIPVNVDEVNLTFSVKDEAGRWIDDLQLPDLRLLDNGKKPLKVLSFQKLTNLPVHAGILVDTSRSMVHDMPRNRLIVSEMAEHVLRSGSDEAFVMQFDFQARIKQDWTRDSAALTASMNGVAKDWRSRLGGTGVFDSIYIACRDQFGGAASGRTGNFILLFSDGLDNESHARMEDVINRCQQSHTSIYVFSDEPNPSHEEGQKVLQELAAKSGGRVLYDQDKGQLENLRLIEGDVRNQYEVVYKPLNLKVDGVFHRIKLDCPHRSAFFDVRTGYYAHR